MNTNTIPSSSSASRSSDFAPVEQKPVEFSKPSLPTNSGVKTNSGLAERDLVAPTAQIDGSGNSTVTSAVNRAIDSSECTNADSEIQKAEKVIDSSDKLFHIRRALRLCPTNANYHSKLGDLYLSMNRADDAKFEYQEALKIDPTLSSAQAGLENLQRGASVSSKPVTFGGGEAAKLPSKSGSDRY
jgi:tetratricopeptide (TPR) repeat protein